MKRKSQILAAAIFMGLLATEAADAGVISVANPSFETLPAGGLPFGGCGTGCSYSSDNIPGWTSMPTTAFSGQFQPGPASGNTSIFNSVPDGLTVAYTNGGTISQVIGSALVGVTYTLNVDVGFRKDIQSTAQVLLVVDGHFVNATGTPDQLSGNWVDYTASYTVTPADTGFPIEIILRASGDGGQGDWDNVRLTDNIASPVPEPATWAMMLVGFLGLGGAAVRRRCALALR
jgi:hypothetical protein